MNRIERKFNELRRDRKKAFIAFITAGYPSLAVTKKLILEFARIGVDIIELGVPFSDPMSDGPIIQESSQFALRRNTQLKDILKLVKEVRCLTAIPLCLMTYYNPIFCFPQDNFLRQARGAGVDGVIIPDLPPDEGRGLLKSAGRNGLDVICFISPTTSLRRAKFIAGIARGFIYYVSLTGVTGERQALPSDMPRHVRALKRITSKPICVGFGVSQPRQVKEIYRFADGVIVGSAIVKKIKENIHRKDLVQRVSNYVKRLKDV
jgi:tryptophan synthase alpha chain